MKYLLFILFFSIDLNAQEIVTVNRSEVLEALGHTVLKTHQDSVMMDSINKMIEVINKLDATIYSLKDSVYSNSIRKIAYELYIIHIDRNIDKQLNLITDNLKEYKLFGKTHDSGSMYNTVYISKSETLHSLIAKNIMDRNLLNSCEFFDNKNLIKNQIYDLTFEIPFQFGYIEYIAFLMKNSVNKLTELKKASVNQCLIENIDYIINTGKKNPHLKEYYK